MLSTARLPAAGERVLVIAPHPDDEALGVGGLIHSARRAGADVTIGFLTSGDGFPLAAASTLRRLPVPVVMRRFAAIREAEATAAAETLGVAASGVRFLGYPDRGLAPMWGRRDRQTAFYRSPYTRATHTDGRHGPVSTFCAAALVLELGALLQSVRPLFLYVPDPLDDHPDHWAGAAFVHCAVASLPRGVRPEVMRSYLIHRGPWPPSRGDTLEPPASLATSALSFETMALDGAAQEAKASALRAHRSQHRWCGGFLRRFLRSNELLVNRREYEVLLAWTPPAAPEPGRDRAGQSVRGVVAATAESLRRR